MSRRKTRGNNVQVNKSYLCLEMASKKSSNTPTPPKTADQRCTEKSQWASKAAAPALRYEVDRLMKEVIRQEDRVQVIKDFYTDKYDKVLKELVQYQARMNLDIV